MSQLPFVSWCLIRGSLYLLSWYIHSKTAPKWDRNSPKYWHIVYITLSSATQWRWLCSLLPMAYSSCLFAPSISFMVYLLKYQQHQKTLRTTVSSNESNFERKRRLLSTTLKECVSRPANPTWSSRVDSNYFNDAHMSAINLVLMVQKTLLPKGNTSAVM